MNIVEQRFLRGPNLWSRKSCLMTVVELGELADCMTTDLAGFGDDLLDLVPALRDFSEPMQRGSFVAEVIGQLTLALQRMAGSTPRSSFVAAVRGKQQQVKIIVAYDIEALAVQAFGAALGMVQALCAGENVNAAEHLAALSATVRRHALGPQAAALADAARDRGIPVIRRAAEGDEVQLGWGARQKMLPANASGAPGPILDALFKGGDGRIPVVAVTGTNGKTTTTLMIEHCARMAGLASAAATTEGVYIAGRRVMDGDCAGFHSARLLLTSPSVEFAVLETARGGILKRGLAFDYCTAAVILNVSADHLGLDGVETIEDLARVKAVVAQAASRAVVLNADDRHCAAMRGVIAPGVETIYFSMQSENAVLLRHLEQGGRAACFKDGALVWADGAGRMEVLAASSMPAAIDGHARHNIANGLAATAALMGIGFGLEQVARGLSTFVSDFNANPLRSNLYCVRGVTIVVDYAHNPAAYAALAAMAGSLSRGRKVAVLTSPGDRRDHDLHDIGRTCALGFDELFVYEADPRGRPSGETARVILDGARGTGIDERLLHAVVPVAEAFEAALQRCAEGDVLVFACGSAATAQMLAGRFAADAGPEAPKPTPTARAAGGEAPPLRRLGDDGVADRAQWLLSAS